MWVVIPGYKYEYRISSDGEIQRLSEDVWTNVKPYKQHNIYCVTLIRIDRSYHNVSVSRLIDDAFFGSKCQKQNLVQWHKNGCAGDFRLSNIELITKSERSKRNGGKNRRAVLRTSSDGSQEIYKSVKAAAKANGMSPESMRRRLRQRILDPRGTVFKYDR